MLVPSTTPPRNRRAALLRSSLAALAFCFPHVLTSSLTSLETKVKANQNTRDARQDTSKPMDYRNETVLLQWC
ncbi:hypothetical protein Y032_0459g1843 [Ancylostoma ceylanicum]|uniref:Uncharacterized protein n=1 Tax=Ancylostoma ceylanicum TaxID=53326 RepID=A0A016WZT7_9BILA|nr:hypothetical protein Y032_0459g1843 [Ancylostoma ceylanicum]